MSFTKRGRTNADIGAPRCGLQHSLHRSTTHESKEIKLKNQIVQLAKNPYVSSLTKEVPRNKACHQILDYSIIFFKILFIYFYTERKGERQRGGETSVCGCPSRGPHWGSGPQPRHVPWLGIKLATLWFTAHAQSMSYTSQGSITFLILTCGCIYWF